MINVDKAFEINSPGLLTTDGQGVSKFYLTSSAGDPTGSSAPINTLVLREDNQTLWYKFGSGNNDWRQLRANDIAFNVSSLTANSPDLTGLTQTFAVISALANRHFGKGFGIALTPGNFQTTSSSFQTIQTVTPTQFSPGDYIVISFGCYLKTVVSARIETRLLLNGSTELNVCEVAMDDDDYFFNNVSIGYAPGLVASPTVNLQMRKVSGGGNIQAENRLLMLWRVS